MSLKDIRGGRGDFHLCKQQEISVASGSMTVIDLTGIHAVSLKYIDRYRNVKAKRLIEKKNVNVDNCHFSFK